MPRYNGLQPVGNFLPGSDFKVPAADAFAGAWLWPFDTRSTPTGTTTLITGEMHAQSRDCFKDGRNKKQIVKQSFLVVQCHLHFFLCVSVRKQEANILQKKLHIFGLHLKPSDPVTTASSLVDILKVSMHTVCYAACNAILKQVTIVGHQGPKEFIEFMIGWKNWRSDMHEWLHEYMNECMNDWLNDWMTEWLSDWMTEWLNDWLNEGRNEGMNEGRNEWKDGWKGEGMNDGW